MNVIELDNITKVFGKGDSRVEALSGINLAIEPGELVAIVGPSGSGKSTLMNIIGLLDVASDGQYLLDGKPVKAKRESELAKLRRHKIGFVFQNFNLLPRLNVLQNVMLPMAYTGVPGRKRKARALELLSTVGVKDRAKHKLSQISGGQTQRVAIARALANRPSLILADEPTGNLDSKSSQNVIDLLLQLNAAGSTIIMVTHNDAIADQASRVVTILDGKITQDRRLRQPASGRKTVRKVML